jgi:polyphosphate kinase
MKVEVLDKSVSRIFESDLVSRDLSWLKFNQRVLDQAKNTKRTIFDRLKFLAITSSNLDEFFMIRVGSLYNYIDFDKKRIDYSGLREIPFKKKLLTEAQEFCYNQNHYFTNTLTPLFKENNFSIERYEDLSREQKEELDMYFSNTIYPMLTPMLFDSYHPFPLLTNMRLMFGAVTKKPDESKKFRKLSFIQVPRNLPRFYEFETDEHITFVPIEDIIRNHIDRFFKNVDLLSVTLFRVSRNSDFTLEESEDIETNFLEELKRKLKTRRTGRVVKFELQGEVDNWMMDQLKDRWEIDDYNIFQVPEESIMDFTSLWQIVNHNHFKDWLIEGHLPVPPVSFPLENKGEDIFEILKERDVMIHLPYNTMEPVLDLIEKSADDPNVLAIKITLYRVAKESRVTAALARAAENGKHVSVLFEVKARFDEENNLREAEILQRAGCFVIYGVSSFKTHTKLCLIVRKEGDQVQRYVHMATGNYNENTAKLYTDIGVLSSNDKYADDVSEFFNVITGHSLPSSYENLLTAPRYMRDRLIEKIQREAKNAKNGLASGMVIKVNSLQDKKTINALYEASQAGVVTKLIVRGICCLRPGREGLSENISVCSIVGDYLEHSRIYYFHNHGKSEVYIGSADAMVRSFDRRLESMFRVEDKRNKQEAINILAYNLKDNVNSYIMSEDGNYRLKESNGAEPFSVHEKFYIVDRSVVKDAKLF